MSDNYDGLESQYDLIIYGTGLSESIISCAAGKAGLKVLHLDRNDYYGDKYNAHSLSAHVELFASRSASDKVIECPNPQGDPNNLKMNNGISDFYVANFQSVPLVKLASLSSFARGRNVRTDMDVNKVHPACFGYGMEPMTSGDTEENKALIHPVFHKYVKHSKINTFSRILSSKSRDFNVDCTSKLVLGTGLFIECLISSGVHKYLEFKSIEALSYYLNEKDGLWKVPCSRVDVFNTTTLTALEKRIFMKFYSFVLDYGHDVFSGKDVATLNENELATGRSLYRPQNKQKEYSGYDVHTYLDRPFEDFLTSCKLSPKLQNIIMYALCFRISASNSTHAADAYSTAIALRDLYVHINSLGRFGETAFLTPLYGTSEVTQAFCRMSAVWGSIFMLRCGVDSLSISEESSEGADSKQVTTKKISEVKDTLGRVFKCKAFVCNLHHFPYTSTLAQYLPTCFGFTVTRICVCWGYLLSNDRGIVIIPPHSLGSSLSNSHAIHVVQSESGTSSAHAGCSVLHITTVMLLDKESADKMANGTSWTDVAKLHSDAASLLMDRVVAFLQSTAPTERSVQVDAESTPVTTVNDFQVWTNSTTLSPLYTEVKSDESVLPTNLGLCFDESESFHLNDVIERSKQIFLRLFPDKPFLVDETVAEESEAVDGEESGVTRRANTGEQTEDELETAFFEATLNSLKPTEN